jgi:preprotein translocase subunit YajC
LPNALASIDLTAHFGIYFKGMSLDVFNLLIAQAGTETVTRQDPKAQFIQQLVMIGGLVLVMYFVILRPQQKRAKQQESMLKVLKAGDKVVTTSGIVGVVVALKERTVTLRSADTKIEVVKSSIADVTDRDAAAPSESQASK